MLGQQFYHETMRKVVVSFGTIFNNINIVRKNNAGTILREVLEYAQIIVENERSNVRTMEVRLLNLCSKHMRKKIEIDNAEKIGT